MLVHSLDEVLRARRIGRGFADMGTWLCEAVLRILLFRILGDSVLICTERAARSARK